MAFHLFMDSDTEMSTMHQRLMDEQAEVRDKAMEGKVDVWVDLC